MKYNELHGLIVKDFGNVKNFCENTGVPTQKIYNKLRGRVKMNTEDIAFFVKSLHIPTEKIGHIFL